MVSYQSTTDPLDAVALSVTVPFPQRELSAAEGSAGKGFTVAVTGVLITEEQPEIIPLEAV